MKEHASYSRTCSHTCSCTQTRTKPEHKKYAYIADQKSEFEFFHFCQNDNRSLLKFLTKMKHGFESVQVKIQPGLNQVKNYSEINSDREMRETVE